jgi:hypothetical protein
MVMSDTARRAVARPGAPSGLEPLAVRERYLHERRRVDGRGWVGIWVTVFAVMSWLLIIGLTGLLR